MANGAPSKTVLIAALVIAGGAMFILNNISQRLNPAEQERLQKEAEAQKAAEAAKNAPSNTPPPVPPPGGGAASGGDSSLTALGQNAILGNKDSKQEVVIRWRWTPDVQADPSKVQTAVQTAVQALPSAKIVVQNVDEDPEAPTGIFVGAQQVASAAPDGSITVVPPAVQAALEKQPK